MLFKFGDRVRIVSVPEYMKDNRSTRERVLHDYKIESLNELIGLTGTVREESGKDPTSNVILLVCDVEKFNTFEGAMNYFFNETCLTKAGIEIDENGNVI